jgi:hypothetical protein
MHQLPQLLSRKIYKTGQTRGADDDVIFQNRVSRNSTVLIPFHIWSDFDFLRESIDYFENGFIVLINPETYFDNLNNGILLQNWGLTLGVNCLVIYETRQQWNSFNPDRYNWVPANSRRAPLGGHFVARVPATTSVENGEKINLGYSTTNNKGAGIRLYEYATTSTIELCRTQLEAIFWHCRDSIDAVREFNMSEDQAIARRNFILNKAESDGLLDYNELRRLRILDESCNTVCPLCRKRPIKAVLTPCRQAANFKREAVS